MSAQSPRKAACDHVYRAFPDLQGTKPTLRRTGPNRVFIFEKALGPAGGPALKQIVKVTVDDTGKVLKVVASR